MNGAFLGGLGHLVLGSRLKRTGTLLQAETQAWLRKQGCELPPGHMPLLAALDAAGPVSLGTLVEMLGVAQPGVSRVARDLEAGGWITVTFEKGDKRVRTHALTDRGISLVAAAKSDLWPIVGRAVADLCADLVGPLTDQLDGLERKIAAGGYQNALAEEAKAWRTGDERS